jgi:hypothetical protein
VKCVHCGTEMQLRAEHCPACGKRAVVDFDMLTESVHEDAAARRGDNISSYMRWILLAMLIAGAVIYSVNDLYDKPLNYDGAGLPAVQASGNLTLDLPSIEKAFADPRAKAVLPAPNRTAFAYRVSPMKDRLRQAGKGDIAPEKLKSVSTSIGFGLKFLATNQTGDGSWPTFVHPRDWEQWNTAEYRWGNVGVTALVVMAFLGEGETWPDEDKPKSKSIYGDKIKKGLRYLAAQQDPKTGRFGPAEGDLTHHMYNQGMATMAVCEAAGLSGDEQLREIAQKAVDYIVRAQTAKGGWNYHGRSEGKDDTSVSSWQVQALFSAKEIGLQVPDEALKKALKMYQEATQAEGFVRYEAGSADAEDANRISLCGVALMTRQLLGEDARTPVFQKLSAKLIENAPDVKTTWGGNWRPKANNNDDPARSLYDPYRMYFASYGIYFLGGRDWETWNEIMKRSVITMQSSDGAWRTNDPWSLCAGTYYSTAMSILTLQVYYRYQ